MSTRATPNVVLAPAVRDFVDHLLAIGGAPANRNPETARAVLERVQSGAVDLIPAEVEPHAIPGGPRGEISLTVVRPLGSNGNLPVTIYFHGGGWVAGNFGVYERLIRELAVAATTAIVFVNLPLAPESRYPEILETAYAATRWVAERGSELGLNGRRLALAGDSTGANLVAAVTLLGKARGGPAIRCQLLFYPVLDADRDTDSYERFAAFAWHGRDTMRWFWEQYAPDVQTRNEITASPAGAAVEQLLGLPPALIVTAEADVTRDEAEAYGAKLREAMVPVTVIRYPGMIHDFVLLNALAETTAARAAVALAAQTLAGALRHDPPER